MEITIIIKLKELTSEETVLLNNYISKEIYKFNGEEFVPTPTTNPSPVLVIGPMFPGDPRGLTFTFKTLKDTNAFIKHVQATGFVEDFWIRPEYYQTIINTRGLDKLDIKV